MIMLISKQKCISVDDLLRIYRGIIPNLTKERLHYIINAHPSIFSIQSEGQIGIQALNIEFVETCFQNASSTKQKLEQQTDLDSNIANNEAFEAHFTKTTIRLRNFRVFSVDDTGIVFNPTGNRLYHVKWDTGNLEHKGRNFLLKKSHVIIYKVSQ